MSNVEWLLRESFNERVFDVGTMNTFNDAHWRGTIERQWLGPGLSLVLTDVVINKDMAVEAHTDRTDAFLYSQITLKGSADVDFLDGRRTVTNMDRAFVVRPGGDSSQFSFRGGTRFLASGFDLDLPRIVRLFDDDVPDSLSPLLAENVASSLMLPVRATSLIRSLGTSLFGAGLHGPLRTLMQEGAVLQLLALMIAASSESTRLLAEHPFPARERNAIHEARDRLLADMVAPPTLGELASAVGLTEKRLNAGFKELFGTTVFEALRNERLEHARIVLESGEMTIKEISYRVGFKHVSNFVSAFKARHGVSPKRYLLEKAAADT